MAEFTIKDEDLASLKGKVAIVTGTIRTECSPCYAQAKS